MRRNGKGCRVGVVPLWFPCWPSRWSPLLICGIGHCSCGPTILHCCGLFFLIFSLNLFNSLVLRNSFKVNELQEVKDRNDHGLLLRSAHLGLLEQTCASTGYYFALWVIGEPKLSSQITTLFRKRESGRIIPLMSMQHSRWNCLWSSERICGTNLTQALGCFRSLVKTVSRVPVLMPTASDIPTLPRQSCITNLCTSSIFFSLRALFGAPDLGPSSTCSFPSENQLNHL